MNIRLTTTALALALGLAAGSAFAATTAPVASTTAATSATPAKPAAAATTNKVAVAPVKKHKNCKKDKDGKCMKPAAAPAATPAG